MGGKYSPGASIDLEIFERKNLDVPHDISVLSACTTGATHTAHPVDEFPMNPFETCKRAVDVLIDVLEGKRADKGHVDLISPEFVSAGTMSRAKIRSRRSRERR